MKRLFLALCLLLAAAMPACAATANSFYVATNGSDSNPGTGALPFATLAKCQTAMRASTVKKTCYIRGGTYKPTSVGTGCGDNLGIALKLSSLDNGTTWSWHAPDGYNSAIIDGQAVGNTGLGFGICSEADNVKIIGLHFKNFQVSGINVSGLAPIVKYNIVDNITNTLRATYCIGTNNAPNGKIVNNVVKNCTDMGIGSWPTSPGGVNYLLISRNYVTNACSFVADCGGIYIENNLGGPHVGQQVSLNYITNVGGGGGGEPIYIDDGSSDVKITGNVMAGSKWQCYFVHGGSNNKATGNICDLGFQGVMGPVSAQIVGEPPLIMSGNTWANNLILADSPGSSAGGGYGCNEGPCQMVIGPNSYKNYNGTGINASGSLGSESNYTYQNPNFTCGWTYQLPTNSPVYNPPTLFPVQPVNWGQPGFWGPPGFTIPRTGTRPSPPHQC